MRWYFERRSSGCSGWWKAFGIIGMLFGIAMTGVSVFLNHKNKKYRDALISLSDHLPGEEDAESRRAAWRSHHAPANRVTVEERLEQNRMEEE